MSKAEFLFLYVFIALIAFIYAQKAANNPKKQGKLMARILYLGCGVIMSYSITLLTNNYFIMSLGNTGVFLLLDWLLFFMMDYVFLFTEQKGNYSIVKNILILFLAADNVCLLINPFYELSLTYELVFNRKDAFLNFEPMPPYYIHLLLCYLMFAFILVMLIGKSLQIPGAYRTKYRVLYVALIGSVGINAVIWVKGWHIDISIIFYGLTSCLFYFVSFHYKPISMINNMRSIIVEGMNNPVVLFDYEGKLVTSNRQAKMVFSLNEEEEGEKTLKSFMEDNNFSDMIKIPKRSWFDTKVEKDEKEYWYHVDYANLSDSKARYLGGLFVFTDITEQKKASFELEYWADHDYLTGTFNRNYFLKTYESYEKMSNLGIAICNINGLKLINDFYGNAMGDKVICQVAVHIKERLRPEDVLIRLDGDGFLVIMPDASEKIATSVMKDIDKLILEDKDSQLEFSIEFGLSIKDTEQSRIENCMIQARNTMYQKKMLNNNSTRSSIIESLKKSLSKSDFESEEHAERTKKMALRLGEKLGLSDREMGELALLSILHDIGKIAVPDHILSKPSKLSKNEWEIMEIHVVKGCEIAKTTSELESIAEYILHHHERWDGKGYPSGLYKEQIPLFSRIIAIVDSYDVMTHNQPYQKAMSGEEAKEEMIRCSGSQFDPGLVRVFLELIDEQE